MSESNTPSMLRATPRQLALVAVLSAIFVVVLIVQFGGGSDADGAVQRPKLEEESDPTASADEESRGRSHASAVATASGSVARPWPTLPPHDVLAYDPFAIPPTFLAPDRAVDAATGRENGEEGSFREAQRRQEEQRQALHRLRQAGVKAIVGGGDGRAAALIGSQTVRVGDSIEGLRVIAVEPDGLVVQLPTAEPPSVRPESP
ncbi:MAG: hypothetical protein ACYTG0_27765 [Planctomycetota bacterium]|jgi:hypothetical protein